MKRILRWVKRVTAFSMVFMVMTTTVLSGNGIVKVKAATGSSAVAGSPLMISGLVPDTDNVSGADAYEYVEIYNTSNAQVNLDDYDLHYSYGTTDTVWNIDQKGILLEAGKSIAFWVINSANSSLTVDNFNNYYKTSLVLGKSLATMHNDGLHNSSERYLSIVSKVGETLCKVRYNDSNVKAVVLKGEITYSYDMTNVNETRLAYNSAAAPASVLATQIPTKTFGFLSPSDLKANVLINTTLIPDQNYNAVINAVGTNRVIEANLYIKGQDDQQYTVVAMTLDTGVICANIPYSSLADKKSVTAYAVVSDGITEVTTNTVTTTILSNSDFFANPSPLVITEILPDSSNVGASDGYEYIEVYNNSNENISFKDYKLYYNYPDNGDASDVMWDSIPSDLVINAGKTLVFWIKNGTNNTLTANDFNTKFGTNLVMGTNLVEIFSGGMANSGARAIRLTTNVKEQLDFVAYNMSSVDDTTADKTIQYQYNMITGKSVMKSNSALPTPGAVSANEKPIRSVVMGISGLSPVVTDMTASSFSSANDLLFAAKAQAGNRSVKTVELHLKDNTMTAYETYNLLGSTESLFSKTIQAVDLSNKSSYTYYFVVSDGVNTVNTAEKTISTLSAAKEPITLNIADNQILSGKQSVLASALDLAKPIKLVVSGEDVSSKTVASLEKSAIIAFDVSQTDTFFKNAVAIGDNLIGVFDDGTYSEWKTIVYDIPVEYFQKGKNLTISIHAGNKANALEHNDENNDDFVLNNIRLILPDGQTIRAAGYVDPDKIISMGDSAGKIEILDATFSISDSSYTGIRYSWDTTTSTDGSHAIEATCGTNSDKAQVIVDNTVPEIVTNMENKQYKGNIKIEGSATDKTTKVSKLSATLDGKKIELPMDTSSSNLVAGNHTLVINSFDEAGNKAEKTVIFTTPVENPDEPKTMTPENDAVVEDDPILSVTVTDPTSDEMTVTFKTGEHYELGDEEITSASGVSQIAGNISSENVTDGYPYQTYDIGIKNGTLDDEIAGIHWSGEANASSKVSLYAFSTKENKWNLIKTVTTGTDGLVLIDAEVSVGDYRDGNVIKIMVQNGFGYTPTQYAAGTAAKATANTEITTSNIKDTDRSTYDFTFAVESDTQYYNENLTNIFRHQLNINDWLVANQPRMNIQYMSHTGDIIDDVDEKYEWENADAAYKILDKAGLAYGVLAGNHDVGHKAEDYSTFGTYFGENRFSNNAWYGQSYKNNKGHYDLISVDGIDFIMIYMGWGIGDDEINWMNGVLAQFPERKAILNFHEYLLTTNGLGEEPQRVHDEVVAVNPNVCMVLSGHYHSATTRVDQFDDNKDGVMDRSVYQMLFDYQGLEEGGRGFIRLMHFSLDQQNITIRTYSPSEDSYASGVLPAEQENFTITFAELGIKANDKMLKTTTFSADIYSNEVIGTVEHVASGDTASVAWVNANSSDNGWYAQITDIYGGVRRTSVQYVTVNNNIIVNDGNIVGDIKNSDNNLTNAPSTGDATNHYIWISVLLASGAWLGLDLLKSKKRRNIIKIKK